MNVAFPAIFIFCLLLPGFLFRQFYQRREVRSFEHSPFSTVALEAGTGLMQDVLPVNFYTAIAVALPVINAVLRVVTHEALGRREA